MKRLLTLLTVLLLAGSTQLFAQKGFGVTAGVGFNTSKFSNLEVKSKAGWNIGVAYSLDLPLGFSLQPSLIYNQKTANLANGVSQSMGFVELPVSVQWGPDLLIFRPFVDVTPYIGYALSNKFSADIAGLGEISDDSWTGKQRFEYGLGLGAGIDVWRFRVIARYNWNFGSLYGVDEWKDIKDQLNLLELNSKNPNFGGVSVSLAYFF